MFKINLRRLLRVLFILGLLLMMKGDFVSAQVSKQHDRLTISDATRNGRIISIYGDNFEESTIVSLDYYAKKARGPVSIDIANVTFITSNELRAKVNKRWRWRPGLYVLTVTNENGQTAKFRARVYEGTCPIRTKGHTACW